MPKIGLLFQGDLGWYTPADGPTRVGQRAAGLLQACAHWQIAPERFLQSWPLENNPAIMEAGRLRALVRERQKNP